MVPLFDTVKIYGEAVAPVLEPGEWGRCEVTFTDGSRLTMVIGMVDVAAANGFVRALSGTG